MSKSSSPLAKAKVQKKEKKIPDSWSIDQCITFLNFLEKQEFTEETNFSYEINNFTKWKRVNYNFSKNPHFHTEQGFFIEIVV
ncbi:hypothetical protein [Gottfriedia acidiceleris]|uniref:hypothetical protein n=1 Tax=Gottfriedia acidiceleris TaxID=371036 RepID=UPI003D201D0E